MSKVCLDPGHGIETPGKRSPDGRYREYEFALDMAQRIQAILDRHGVAVTLTRQTDNDVTLAQRVKTANAVKDLDLFVSIHSNAAGSGADWMSARGLEDYVYISSAASVAAGKAILERHIEAGVTVRNGGKPRDGSNLYVVRKTNAPAVLIEHLFHDNREDVALLLDSAYRQKMAEADAKGILDYLNITYKEDDIDMTKDDVTELVQKTVDEAVKPLDEALTRALNPTTYDTVDACPAWAQTAVRWAVDSGYIQGDEQGRLGLDATRLWALQVTYNIMHTGEA